MAANGCTFAHMNVYLNTRTDSIMKPPSYWRDILCNRFIVNTKDSDVILNFVKDIQEDARKHISHDTSTFEKEGDKK